MRKWMTALVAALVLALPVCKVQAADEYTVFIDSGNQGTVDGGTDTVKVSVDAGTQYTLTYDAASSTATLTSPAGTEWTGPLAITNDKYEIAGFKISGEEKDQQYAVSFNMQDKDMHFVVSYTLPGDKVAYTVRCVNSSGTVLQEDTYHGKVNTKPIVAAPYIEGYLPSANNVTKTIVADESQNVMTITYYTPEEAGGGTIVVTETEYRQGETTVNPGGGTGGGGAVNPAGGGGGGGQNVEPAPAPIEIDDQDVPQAGPTSSPTPGEEEIEPNQVPASSGAFWKYIAAGVGVAALLFLIAFLLLRNKGDEEE